MSLLGSLVDGYHVSDSVGGSGEVTSNGSFWKQDKKPGKVAYACNHSTQESEAGGLL